MDFGLVVGWLSQLIVGSLWLMVGLARYWSNRYPGWKLGRRTVDWLSVWMVGREIGIGWIFRLVG